MIRNDISATKKVITGGTLSIIVVHKLEDIYLN